MKKHGLEVWGHARLKRQPDKFIRQNQISILYLGGYERVVQSTIVSIILEIYLMIDPVCKWEGSQHLAL